MYTLTLDRYINFLSFFSIFFLLCASLSSFPSLYWFLAVLFVTYEFHTCKKIWEGGLDFSLSWKLMLNDLPNCHVKLKSRKWQKFIDLCMRYKIYKNALLCTLFLTPNMPWANKIFLWFFEKKNRKRFRGKCAVIKITLASFAEHKIVGFWYWKGSIRREMDGNKMFGKL